MIPDSQTPPSNIKGSRGRPIKRQGSTNFRDALNGYDVPLRERVRARNLDHRIAKEEAAAATAPTGSTQAATGTLLADRQGLFREMELAGPQGISQAMRDRGRELGVADADFNSAADRVSKNASFTPESSWRTPPAVTGTPVNPSTPATARKAAVTSPAVNPAVPAPRPINPLTGMKPGTLPGDPGFNSNWKDATPYAEKPDAANQPPTDQMSDIAKQAMQIQKTGKELVGLRDGVREGIARAESVKTPVSRNILTSPNPENPMQRAIAGQPAWRTSPSGSLSPSVKPVGEQLSVAPLTPPTATPPPSNPLPLSRAGAASKMIASSPELARQKEASRAASVEKRTQEITSARDNPRSATASNPGRGEALSTMVATAPERNRIAAESRQKEVAARQQQIQKQRSSYRVPPTQRTSRDY